MIDSLHTDTNANTNVGLDDLASCVLQAAKAKSAYLATAESCTGGLIMAALTDIAGSSASIDRAFVTYTNKAKMQMLGVQANTLREHGAVSNETAAQMAEGALKRSAAHLVVAVTGVAGPGGGTPEKPVGTVCFGLAYQFAGEDQQIITSQTTRFDDQGRAFIRFETAKHALEMMLKALST